MERNYTMSVSTLKSWFNEYNEKYFNGELHNYWRFQIKASSSYNGKCFYEKHLIIMSNFYDRTERNLRQTFIHEMIHAYQYENGLDLGHGVSFKRKANEINKDGWEITRCSNDYAKALYTKKRRERKDSKSAIIFMWDELGRKCFSKVAKSSVDYLWEYIQNNPDTFKNPIRFIVPNDYELDQFRKSNSNLNYYYYDMYRESLGYLFAKHAKK